MCLGGGGAAGNGGVLLIMCFFVFKHYCFVIRKQTAYSHSLRMEMQLKLHFKIF